MFCYINSSVINKINHILPRAVTAVSIVDSCTCVTCNYIPSAQYTATFYFANEPASTLAKACVLVEQVNSIKTSLYISHSVLYQHLGCHR